VTRTAAWVSLLLIACTAGAHAQAPPRDRPLRVFFISDVHDRGWAWERIIADVARQQPDLVIDAGDFVHDGTESEFLRAAWWQQRLVAPYAAAPGNHDVVLRGPFAGPEPVFHALQSVEVGGVRFILLDNAKGVIGAERFAMLEAELAAHPDARFIVVMHVPPFTTRPTLAARLRHLAPLGFAAPYMADPVEVARFTALMEQHGVLAVLTGHSHAREQSLRNGVHYITGGAAGGLLPGFRVPNEYLDITIDGRDMVQRRVIVRDAHGDPFTLITRTFAFYRELNGANHAMQGWSYTPSGSVQLRGGVWRPSGDDRVIARGIVEFERLFEDGGRSSAVADVGLGVGVRDLLAEFGAGGRLRPVGDYNRGVYVGGGAGANLGLLDGRATAGIGLRVAAGVEWRGVTVEAAHARATNVHTTGILIGRRY
jgi:predicted phosphodiesterase